MSKLILASGSPRRRELLALIGLPFEVMVSDVDENISGDVVYIVEELARRKAQAVADKLQESATVIAADTLVSVDNRILEKPTDREQAFHMLHSLQGRSHMVYTGVAVLHQGVTHSFVEATAVTFRTMSDQDIWRYIDTDEPFDKAGGYGIQGLGATFVNRIEGDYYSVMGLPVSRLYETLATLNIITN